MLEKIDEAALNYIRKAFADTGHGVSVPAIGRYLVALGYRDTSRFVARRLVERLIDRGFVARLPKRHGGIIPARDQNTHGSSETVEEPKLRGRSTKYRPVNLWTITSVKDFDFQLRRPVVIRVDLNLIPLKPNRKYFFVRMKSNDYVALRVKSGGVLVVRVTQGLPRVKEGKWFLVKIHGHAVGARRIHMVSEQVPRPGSLADYDMIERLVVRKFRAKGGLLLDTEPEAELKKRLHIYGMIEGAYTSGSGSNLRELYSDKSVGPKQLLKEKNLTDERFNEANAYSY